MARRRRAVEPLPTIWEVDDELWSIIQGILAELDPPPTTGRPRIDQRQALNGIIYQMRSGCQWNHLPRDFGDDASVHRTKQRWVKFGIFERIWATLIENCDELGGVDWEWQSADASMGKARLGGIESDRTQPIVGKTGRNGA
jgi:putative transposase